jgi:hypothetical protein
MMNRGNMGKQMAMPGRRTANMPQRGGMAPPAMQRTANMPQMGGGMAGFNAQLGGGQSASLNQLRGQVMPMKKGGAVKKMAKGGMTRGDGCCMKGKTKGKMY